MSDVFAKIKDAKEEVQRIWVLVSQMRIKMERYREALEEIREKSDEVAIQKIADSALHGNPDEGEEEISSGDVPEKDTPPRANANEQISEQ